MDYNKFLCERDRNKAKKKELFENINDDAKAAIFVAKIHELEISNEFLDVAVSVCFGLTNSAFLKDKWKP